LPRRTNPLQKLALHIQQQLDTTAEVHESEMLMDTQSGRQVEVDITVRGAFGGQDHLMSLECTARGRRADVGWVREMVEKHRTLSTDTLVLVSGSGFSEAALEKARFENVRAVSLQEALDADWTRIVGKENRLFLARYDFSPTGAYLTLREEPAVEFEAGQDTGIVRAGPGGEAASTIKELGLQILNRPDVANQLMNRMNQDGSGTGSVDVTFPEPLYAHDSDGRAHELQKVRYTFTVRRATGPVPLSHGSWQGIPVSFGEGETGFGHTFLAISEHDRDDVRATFTYTDPETGDERTVHFGSEGQGASDSNPDQQPPSADQTE